MQAAFLIRFCIVGYTATSMWVLMCNYFLNDIYFAVLVPAKTNR